MQLEVMPKSCGGDTSISRVENAVREESQGSVIRTKFKYCGTGLCFTTLEVQFCEKQNPLQSC